MAFSLGIIIILGLIFNKFFEKIKLPGLLGLLILGILIGPYGMGLLGKDILSASGDLRKISLIVILLRAGLGIRREDLKENGISALKMSFIPGVMEGFTKIWIFAQMLLFILVGAEVNIAVALKAGKIGAIIILIGLIARSIGVIISLIGSGLNFKEKLFCIISYTPKATVQAAIGSIPLTLGVEGGR